jgi:hypothetical protein
MPAKTRYASKGEVASARLPQYDKTYTVIPHSSVIDQTYAELQKSGFRIKNEKYKEARGCNIVQGIYHLEHGDDPDMGLMFAWTNSYDKSMRFKCAVGAHVYVCDNGVMSGDMSTWARKHTGTADQEMNETVSHQIRNATSYYSKLIQQKNEIKNIGLTKSEQGEIIGKLFIEHEVLTLTQLGIVQRELGKPSHNYGVGQDSAWALYNHVTIALKESHPLSFISDHETVHKVFVDTLLHTLVKPAVLQQVYEHIEEPVYSADPSVVYL